jgi:hypothetical protein
VLRIVYALAWLPALAAAFGTRPGWGAPHVLSAAGRPGAVNAAALSVTLSILTAGYLWALRRPPAARTLVVCAALGTAGALALPVLFSADVYAYAYYGDLALHGQNPYAHGAPPPGDPLAAAAVAAWDGRVPPRCVYGPLAVAIAAAADAAGAPGGLPLQLLLQRLAAAAAFAACVASTLRLLPDPRVRAALLLNPVVIWSVGEGHNDAAMLALVMGALAVGRGRPLLLTAAALVKAPALLAWGVLTRRAAFGAAAVVAAGYLPLGLALAADAVAGGAPTAVPGAGVPWDSPLGILAAFVGRAGAAGIAAVALVAAAVAGRRLAAEERVPAFALAAWFALPNAYPWYALWIVPLAARNLSSKWSRALIAAALVAPVRALTDAVVTSDTLHAAAALQPGMIALQFLPALAVLGGSVRLRRSATVLALMASIGALTAAAGAQTPTPPPPAAPNPAPAGAPVTPGTTPSPEAQPAPGTSSVPPTSTPPPAGVAPGPQPQPVPNVMPPPASTTTPVPTPVATNPFGYIITPTPVPVTSPDGPHIIEVDLNDRHIRAGGPLVVRVITSANVVGVEARALGRFIPIPQSSPGLFALAYTLPGGIPFWLLNRSYDVVIAAATADGRQTSVTFPMLLTR